MIGRKHPSDGDVHRSHFLVLVALLVLAPVACADADGGAPAPVVEGRVAAGETAGETASVTLPPAGYAWVIFAADTVLAEVAATADERAEGLMYREEVPDGTGMLFVFPDNQPRSFWMANTYVPLDIAYMNPAFRVVDIVPMEPLVTDSYPSQAPAMFGLEVRQGWFAEQGITIGNQAEVVFGVAGQ